MQTAQSGHVHLRGRAGQDVPRSSSRKGVMGLARGIRTCAGAPSPLPPLFPPPRLNLSEALLPLLEVAQLDPQLRGAA